jgi:hypothetical protein
VPPGLAFLPLLLLLLLFHYCLGFLFSYHLKYSGLELAIVSSFVNKQKKVEDLKGKWNIAIIVEGFNTHFQ